MGGIMKTTEMTEREAKMAVVVALGPGKLIADRNEFVPPRLKVGDVVYLNIHAGNKIGVPEDVDFVVKGGGIATSSSGVRGYFNEASGLFEALDDGPDLMINRRAKLQLQTEESVYMKIV